MSDAAKTEYRELRGQAARLAVMSDSERNAMLCRLADALEADRETVFAANREDVLAAEEASLSDALVHRLVLDERKLASAVEGVRSVARLRCPLGLVRERRLLDEGLVLERVTYPIGVIGMIFEARPDALIQIVSLCLKSGNGIILKGGKEASRTNSALVSIIRKTLDGAPWLKLLSSHSDVDEMLGMEGDVDLIIPRGSNAFVRYVMQHTNIPVMGHADGICSVYVDESADIDLAVRVAVDSKVQYPAACNAVETVLVHQAAAPFFIPAFTKALAAHGVIIHADEKALSIIGKDSPDVVRAVEEDFHTEYLGLELALKVVCSFDEAVAHIASHSSHHTDAIITSSEEHKKRFFDEVDSADVFCNCSTRFADGFRFGLGAEVGISTSKLHARGPVGLDGLTTTKWLLSGNGQIVDDYSSGRRKFIHKDLEI